MDERDRRIVEILESYTMAEVAEAFGMSRINVYFIAKKYGVDTKGRRYGKGAIAKRIEESGLLGTMSDVQVAKKLGYSHGYVSKVRRDLGIKEYEE